MSKVKNFIGIDISKLTIDVAVIVNLKKDHIFYQRFKKGKTLQKELSQWLFGLGVLLDQETVFCMESTGLYNRSLVDFLSTQESILWVEMSLHIKRSIGLKRGKSDKLDAHRIVQFAYKNREEIKPWAVIDSEIQKLKDLLVQRERLVEAKKKLQVPLQELKQEGIEKEANAAMKLQKPALDGIDKSIVKAEKEIRSIIASDPRLDQVMSHLCSIVGVGEITSWHFIAYTNGFKRPFNGKQLACYSGVVPFEHDSGTSIKKRPRVSHLANKRLKRLLHLAAISAIVFDPELKAYYLRKVAEGKNKMSVINAVRNKLVLRIVAVVRDQRPFVKRFETAAA